MNLQQLKYVIAVAETGSITEAARRLFISQPGLSSAIKEVESEIKTTIFVRSNHGIWLTDAGAEFLSYARQVIQQQSLLEEKYLSAAPVRQHFSVSAQHFMFSAKAFVHLVQEYGGDEYDFIYRETTTWKIINDVSTLYSEIGILFFSYFNEEVLRKMILENGLRYQELYTATPCVFIRKGHPLTKKRSLTLEDLEPYPCISFEQGRHNSLYFAEEIYSTRVMKKVIHVSDRAALLNFITGLDGYIISTGILPKYLHGNSIITLPLQVEEKMQVVALTHKEIPLSRLGGRFLEMLQKEINRN